MDWPSLYAVHLVGSVKLLAAVVAADEDDAREVASEATGWPEDQLIVRDCGTVDAVPVLATEREVA